MQLFDAHNHVQDARFCGQQDELINDCVAVGLSRMVVNGTCESDWPAVAALAFLKTESRSIPSMAEKNDRREHQKERRDDHYY